MSKGARSDVKSRSEVEILSSLNSISTATYSSAEGSTNKAFWCYGANGEKKYRFGIALEFCKRRDGAHVRMEKDANSLRYVWFDESMVFDCNINIIF